MYLFKYKFAGIEMPFDSLYYQTKLKKKKKKEMISPLIENHKLKTKHCYKSNMLIFDSILSPIRFILSEIDKQHRITGSF